MAEKKASKNGGELDKRSNQKPSQQGTISIERLFEDFVRNIYPKYKRHIIESERLGEKVYAEVWTELRNGLDDYTIAHRFYYEKKDPYEIQKRIIEAAAHCRTAAYDGWLRTSSKTIGDLERSISKMTSGGRLETARRKLKLAKAKWEEARRYYSSDSDETIELLKESCKIAVDGLDCIEYNPPINVFLLILSVILAVILVGMGLFQLLAYFNFFQ